MRVSSMLGVWQGAPVVLVALLVLASANNYYDDEELMANLYKRIAEVNHLFHFCYIVPKYW